MVTTAGDPTLLTFLKVEHDIITMFDNMINTLHKRKHDLLTRLNKMKGDYKNQESIRKSNLKQINAHIEHLEKNKLNQPQIITIQLEHIQRSKQLREQYEQPIRLTALPIFSAPGIDALMAQLDTIGAMEEVPTAYKAKRRPSKRIANGDGKQVTINRPMGVTLDELNRLYVVSLGNAQIQVLQLDGEQVAEFGIGKLSMPHSIAICKQNVFITDFALNAIIKFKKPDYNMVGCTKEGELDKPLGIAFDKNYNVLVADSKNNRVVVYSNELDKVGEFGNELNAPQDVITYLDNIFVADHGTRHNIHVFSNTGQLLRSVLKLTSGGSWLFLAMDTFGNILISDYSGKRVQVLSKDDQTIPSIECKYFATGIAVTSNNQTIIAEFVNNRINFYD